MADILAFSKSSTTHKHSNHHQQNSEPPRPSRSSLLQMAAASSTGIRSFCSFLVLLAAMITQTQAALQADRPFPKKTEMSFYMHDWETATREENITNVAIAGNPLKKPYILEFGSLFAYDDAITLTIDRKSTEIGRAHGIYVNTALDGSDLHIMVSFLFTNKAYNGSTIEIRGADRLLQPTREVAVVSGTGRFRLARGWASVETVFLDIPQSNAILRWNLTVFHY